MQPYDRYREVCRVRRMRDRDQPRKVKPVKTVEGRLRRRERMLAEALAQYAPPNVAA
jgi:hypothetical protein